MPEVEIKIRRERKASNQAPRRGPLNVPRHADEGKRRLKKGINFYDLGQKSDGMGGWNDLDFRTLEDIEQIAISTGAVITECDHTSSHGVEEYYHKLFRAKIFEVDPSNWKTQYRKLTYDEAFKYGVRLKPDYAGNSASYYEIAKTGERLGDTSKWKTQGLATGALSKFYIDSTQLFWYFDNNPVSFKITNVADPTASVVSFPGLSANADIFLVPVLTFYLVQLNVGSTAYAMFGAYAPWSRTFWLDRITNFPSNLFNYSLASPPGVYPLNSGTDLVDLYDHIRNTITLSREFDRISSVITELAAGSVPTSGTSILIRVGFGFTGAPPFRGFPTTSGLSFSHNSGRFVGAVRQNNQMFYFWLGGTGGTIPSGELFIGPGAYSPGMTLLAT